MPENMSDAEFKSAVSNLHRVTKEVQGFAEKANVEIKRLGGAVEGLDEMKARLSDVEQKVARRGGGEGSSTFMGQYHHASSWGETFTKSAAFGALVSDAEKGVKGTTPRVEVKAITSVAGSAGAMIAPDVRTDPVNLPQRPLTIRDLCSPGQTSGNIVYYPRQTTRTNAAAPVAENPSGNKPMSNLAWEQAEARVKTLAHWIPLSRQALDDAPALASTVDSELRYGLVEVEERQLLTADGTGENLLGIIPQATAFDTTLFASLAVVSPTAIDTLLLAVAQAETALLPASGIVLHPLDWAAIWALKDANGRYLTGGPLADVLARFWSIPRVSTTVMQRGQFLVGAFRDGAQIYDRSAPTVQASTEDRDNFVKNMVTVLAEERLAFAVKRPKAFITGSLTPPTP